MPSHSKMDVIAVQFQSHTPGKYDGFLHVKTNFEDMVRVPIGICVCLCVVWLTSLPPPQVIPVDISVIRGGIVSTPPSLSFLSFSSDVVDCEWALSVQKNSSSWADPYPDAIAVSAVHSRLASVSPRLSPVLSISPLTRHYLADYAEKSRLRNGGREEHICLSAL